MKGCDIYCIYALADLFDVPAPGLKYPIGQLRSSDLLYIALFFEAVRKSTDLADGLTRIFQEIKGVLLSGRDVTRREARAAKKNGGLWEPKAIFMKKPT